MTENRSHWQAYVDLLVKKGVSQKSQRYFVGHAESFIQFMKGRPLSQLTVEDVQLFLQNASLQRWVEPWQFEQIVDAKRQKNSDCAFTK